MTIEKGKPSFRRGEEPFQLGFEGNSRSGRRCGGARASKEILGKEVRLSKSGEVDGKGGRRAAGWKKRNPQWPNQK